MAKYKIYRVLSLFYVSSNYVFLKNVMQKTKVYFIILFFSEVSVNGRVCVQELAGTRVSASRIYRHSDARVTCCTFKSSAN